MALAHVLDTQGIHPDALNVTATCDLEVGPEGPRIAAIELEVHGRIPGLDASAFEEASRRAEATCPVSNALRGNLRSACGPCSTRPSRPRGAWPAPRPGGGPPRRGGRRRAWGVR